MRRSSYVWRQGKFMESTPGNSLVLRHGDIHAWYSHETEGYKFSQLGLHADNSSTQIARSDVPPEFRTHLLLLGVA